MDQIDFGLLGSGQVVSEDDKIVVQGRIPGDLELFKDHFPGFPVLPGVLAVEVFKKIVEFANGCEKWKFKAMKRVRFSSYLKPNDFWQAQLTKQEETGCRRTWKAKLLCREQSAVNAQLEFEKLET